MTTKDKPIAPGSVEAPQLSKNHQRDAADESLLGWLSLSAESKESRLNRRQKRGWKRGCK